MLLRRPAAAAAALGLLVLAACAAEPVRIPADDDRLADWWLAEEPANATLELMVFAGSLTCDAYRGVDVTEFEDEVRVTARVDVIGGPDCPPGHVVEEVTVPLAEDLADRELTGCVAPADGLRSPDLDDHEEPVDCRTRRPPP